MDIHFYSLHVCSRDAEGGICVKTSGSEGDFRYTGEERIPPDSPDIEAWRWVHSNRNYFPPIIEQSEFSRIARVFRDGAPTPHIPADGYYFISTEWSGQAVFAQNALMNAHAKNPLPRSLHIIDNDLPDCGKLFPQLIGLLHGWGEIFGFHGGKCDLYLQLGRNTDSLDRKIEFLYKHNKD
jgi:hypothetical protein